MTNHSNKAMDKIKNVLILLLIISALFLGWISRLFGNDPVSADGIRELWRSISGGPAVTAYSHEKKHAAAMPVAVAVTDGESRYGIKYNIEEIKDFYSQTVTVFSQALGTGTAQTPQKTTEDKWQTALKSLGIYYEYLTPVSLSVLAGWYDVAVNGDWGGITVRRLCVTYSEGKNHLYFQDDATGDFYVCGTAVLDDIAGLPGKFGRNSAIFAFQIRETSAAPYTLLMPDVTEHPALTLKNPLTGDQALADVLLTLGVNENTTPSHTETNKKVFVAGNFILSLYRDGTITYLWTEEETETSQTEPGQAIELAYAAVSKTVGKYCGQDAAVYFDSGQALPDGGYRVFFRYVASGGVVGLQPDGYAATVTVKNGVILAMELRFRSFSAVGQTEVLPELLAEAAADSDFMLGYTDWGEAELMPTWVRLPLGH